MQQPWNGVWTHELLRDLCGGITYAYGVDGIRSINVACQRCELFKSERSGIYYGVGTLEIRRFGKCNFGIKGLPPLNDIVEYLTEWLTEVHAIPINDDGSLWVVTDRPSADEDDE